MSVMLVVLVIFAWSRSPGGLVQRVNLGIVTAGVLVLVGFDLMNRTVPHWMIYSIAGVMLVLVCVSIWRNEDGQRDRIVRWYLRLPSPD